MTLRLRGRHLVVLALIAAAAAAVAVLGGGLGRRENAVASIPFEAIERRDIAVTIEATGTVEPIDLVEVKSKASGQILAMPVEVGSVVGAGDLLAQIDTVDVSNQYEQARASLEAARANLDVSTAKKRRADALLEESVITDAEHETSVLDMANAQSQFVRARADLEAARQRRADATVSAPTDGTILEQLVSTGQVIASATSSVSGGTALLKMADLSRIRMRVMVSETDIGSVRPGQAATVQVEAFPDRPFRGTVEKVEPQAVVQQSVTLFPVLVSISNEEGLLLPGMNGEVSMVVEQRLGVPAVPLDAVRAVRELPAAAAALGLAVAAARAQLSAQADERRARMEARRAGAEPGEAAATPGAAGVSPGANAGPETPRAAPAGAGSGSGSSQVVFMRTENGVEPRLVRLGISDFDYAQVISGLEEGDEVALLAVAELEAERRQNQDRIRARVGTGIPGSQGTGGRSSTSGSRRSSSTSGGGR